MTYSTTKIEPDFQADNPATASLIQLANVGEPLLGCVAIGAMILGLSTWGLHGAFNFIPVVGFGTVAFFAAALVLYIAAKSLIAWVLMSTAGVVGEVLSAASVGAASVTSEDVKKFLSLR